MCTYRNQVTYKLKPNLKHLISKMNKNQDKLLLNQGDAIPNESFDTKKEFQSEAPDFHYSGEIKRHVTQNIRDEFDEESQNTSYGCYENSIQAVGDCFGFMRTWLPCICCCSEYPWQVVKQSQQALMQRFGKY